MIRSSNLWNRISVEDKLVIQKYLGEIPVKLGSLAKELGIIVKKSPLLPSNISGQIKRTDTGEYEIKINRFEALTRQRFTLAHEISHFLLHRAEIDKVGAIQDNVLYRSGVSETIEYEANQLAAQLIIPNEAIEKRLLDIGEYFDEGVINQLAEEFGVSKAAMEIRMAA